MKKKVSALLVLACAATFVAGAVTARAASKETKPNAGQKAAQPQQAAAQAPNGGKGKVLETMDAANYTYVKFDVSGTPVWAAAPKFKVKKGDTVVVPAGAPMPGFHSKTLNRTFDMIYFVPSVEVVDPKAKR
ncbi:MAG: hypothetical protein HY900_04850 [Deltaproteobacteria bacterium]|nr:hypothetical protein [Deltaproteobacteria bacterium]